MTAEESVTTAAVRKLAPMTSVNHHHHRHGANASGGINDDVGRLGTILSVWAHPDDETYLAAGIMATASDRDQRVVCVSATAGEHGTSHPQTWPPERLGRVRRWESAAAMAILGVPEHHFLDYEDGTLDPLDVDGIERVAQLIEDVRPDTILTFGADGMTFHADHIAIHRWVTAAWDRLGEPGRLLFATPSTEFLGRFGGQLEAWGIYMTSERPMGVPTERLALHARLSGAELDRKLAALRAMATQTAEVTTSIDPTAYAALVAEESFVAARRTTVRAPDGQAGDGERA